MTERSKTRSGGNATGGPAKGKGDSSLRGLERRARVSRRAAARRKNEDQDSAGDVTPHVSVAAACEAVQPSAASSTGMPSVAVAADETAMLRAALDCMPNCLAVCDNRRVITFANLALVHRLRGLQATIRKRFPGFEAGHLTGSALDRCHDDPVGLGSRLDACGGLPQSIPLQMGELSFVLICRALQDADGKRVGTLVEWVDDPGQPQRAR